MDTYKEEVRKFYKEYVFGNAYEQSENGEVNPDRYTFPYLISLAKKLNLALKTIEEVDAEIEKMYKSEFPEE